MVVHPGDFQRSTCLTFVRSIWGAYVDAGHELQEALQVRDFMGISGHVNGYSGYSMLVWLGYHCDMVYIYIFINHTYIYIYIYEQIIDNYIYIYDHIYIYRVVHIYMYFFCIHVNIAIHSKAEWVDFDQFRWDMMESKGLCSNMGPLLIF